MTICKPQSPKSKERMSWLQRSLCKYLASLRNTYLMSMGAKGCWRRSTTHLMRSINDRYRILMIRGKDCSRDWETYRQGLTLECKTKVSHNLIQWECALKMDVHQIRSLMRWLLMTWKICLTYLGDRRRDCWLFISLFSRTVLHYSRFRRKLITSEKLSI
jgi:hypothetical protein